MRQPRCRPRDQHYRKLHCHLAVRSRRAAALNPWRPYFHLPAGELLLPVEESPVELLITAQIGPLLMAFPGVVR